MLKPRLIPCLLIEKGGLVKTINFQNPKYLGDPLNAVRTFNEMFVDEIIILDIEATKLNKKPNFKLLEKLSSESNMPICYGGGVNSTDTIEKIIQLGIEKVSINSAALIKPQFIRDASNIVGSQSLVLSIDITESKFFSKKYNIFNKNFNCKNINPIDHIRQLQDLGIGEILINSVKRDGTLSGYSNELIEYIKPHIKVPLTILGGAKNYQEFQEIYKKYGLIGMSAGSLFVFKGKYRAVLLQYPTVNEKKKLFS